MALRSRAGREVSAHEGGKIVDRTREEEKNKREKKIYIPLTNLHSIYTAYGLELGSHMGLDG